MRRNKRRFTFVFLEENMEHLGLQVPGGSVDPGESLEEAILREMLEETGLTGLHVNAYLGYHDYTLPKGDPCRRHYFHLEAAEAPDSFTYTVQSGDEDNGWVYHSRWIDMEGPPPALYGQLGFCLNQVWPG